jgi:Zn-dependent M28 family amino/carboxypeptidase
MRIRFGVSVLLLAAWVGAASVPSAQAPAAVPAPAFTAQELMSHVTSLASSDMEGRATGTPGNAKARAFVLEQFRAAGLEPLGTAFELPFSFDRRQPAGGKTEAVKMQGVNIGGICRGRGAKDNGALVMTAHYDHLGVRDAAIYHGADDNASGVTVLLALARQCRQTPWMHDAIFVAFDAEEMGLQGARAFVAALPIPTDRTIALNINLDMVARGDKNELYVAGTHHTPALRPVLETVASRSTIKLLFGHDSGGGQDDWTTQSDHAAFHEAGIPFLYFGVEDHADYHKPTDTADRINETFFYLSALTILDAVTTIDRALPLPSQ